MPRNVAAKSERSSSPPASQTRPKLVPTRPSPMDEPLPDVAAGIDAARIADEYDSIRVKLDEFGREEEQIRVRLIEAMRRANKTNIPTIHGRVTFMKATDPHTVPDEKAAIALLASKGIPQPPTMEAWLAQHGLAMPTKSKDGMPDRIKFEMNK